MLLTKGQTDSLHRKLSGQVPPLAEVVRRTAAQRWDMPSDVFEQHYTQLMHILSSAYWADMQTFIQVIEDAVYAYEKANNITRRKAMNPVHKFQVPIRLSVGDINTVVNSIEELIPVVEKIVEDLIKSHSGGQSAGSKGA